MQLIFKVGNKYPIGHPLHYQGWRDGQLVEIRPSDTPIGSGERKHFVIIEDGKDYFALRGSKDHKADTDKVREFNSLLRVKDKVGRLPWDIHFNEKEANLRKRDHFIDFKSLVDAKLINASAFDSFYDKSRDHESIYIPNILDLIKVEKDKPRLVSKYSDRKGSISDGTHYIGTGSSSGYDSAYTTVTLFEAAIAATLTGDLTGEHDDEETAVSSDITFAFDSATYKFTLTAKSGAEHNGGAYGNGARIKYANYNSIIFDSGDFDDIEISKLALDINVINSYGIKTGSSLVANSIIFNRLLIKGGSSSITGIYIKQIIADIRISNNIIYGISDSYRPGIWLDQRYRDSNCLILNNTISGCTRGIRQEAARYEDASLVLKNNNLQGNTTDYVDSSSTNWGTTSKNISEDATSPDTSYRSKDLHTNSVFKNYASDDYRLDSGGDATNLAIVDDGDDLSATFTDDIQGQTRSTWYIGASEIVSASTPANNALFFGQNF